MHNMVVIYEKFDRGYDWQGYARKILYSEQAVKAIQTESASW